MKKAVKKKKQRKKQFYLVSFPPKRIEIQNYQKVICTLKYKKNYSSLCKKLHRSIDAKIKNYWYQKIVVKQNENYINFVLPELYSPAE